MMRNPRIQFIAAGTFRGNASILRALCLCRELLELNFGASVTLTRGDDSAALAKEKGLVGSVDWTEGPGTLSLVRRALRGAPVEIVHIINANMAGLTVGEWRRGGVYHTVSDWDEWLSSIPARPLLIWKRRFMEHLARRWSDAFIFASRHLLEEYGRRIPHLPQLYLPYALDLRGRVSEGWRSRMAFEEGRRYIVYIGSLDHSYREDLEELFPLSQAARRLGLGLVVAGDGSEKERLSDQFAAMGVDVLMPGRLGVADLDGILASQQVAATFLPLVDNTQNRARCPNKMFHYIRAGKVVITNRVGEVRWILGEKAIYYAFGDPGSLMKALSMANEADPHYDLESMSWRARARQYVAFLETIRAGNPK